MTQHRSGPGALPGPACLGLACLALVGLATLAAPPVLANDYEADLRRLVEERVRPWLKEPVLVDSLRRQDAAHAGLDQAGIDRLDQDWRAEVAAGGTGPMITAALASPLSAFLKDKKQAGDGLWLELFVTDDHGLNAGQSDVTSDFWQGDEPKWQKTYGLGPDAVFVDEVEFDDFDPDVPVPGQRDRPRPGRRRASGRHHLGHQHGEAGRVRPAPRAPGRAQSLARST